MADGGEVRFKVTVDTSELENKLAKMAIITKTMEERMSRLEERLEHVNKLLAKAETTNLRRR